MEQENDNILPKEGKEKKEKKDKKKKLAKIASTMFRNTMSNHLQLSALADRKADLLISINAIIISIMTSFLVHNFAANPNLLIPTGILVLVCLITITLSLFSTRPNVKSISKDVPVSDAQQLDLLFFGDYTRLSKEEYRNAMNVLIAKESQLNDKMLENLYAQGKVIEKKYRLLKWAYTAFMIGFPIAILSYLVSLMVG